MSSLNESASMSNSWSSEDALTECKLSDTQALTANDDPILLIKTTEKCEILHHLVDLSKELQEGRDDEQLLRKNNKMINLLLNLPEKSQAVAATVESNAKPTAEPKEKGRPVIWFLFSQSFSMLW